MLKRLYNWLIIETFPLYLFFILVVPHLIIRFNLQSTHTFDLWYGITLQILGGVVVLYNIDSNLKRHGGNNLIRQAIAWLHRCPFRKRNTVINVKAAKFSVSAGLTSVFNIKNNFDTLEAKVDYIYEQILTWHKEVKGLQKHIDDKCKEIEKSFNKHIENIGKEIEDHREFISKSFTGNIKWELLGILFIIYGISIPLF